MGPAYSARVTRTSFRRFATCLFLLASAAALSAAEPRWWKGNLHTHSLWSDGDDYPEMIASWYKQSGYHFVAFSEHNVFAEGQRWITPTPKLGGGEALDKYRSRFGRAWVEERVVDGTNQVRLKPLAEYRTRLEEPDRFLLVPSEELTDRHLVAPIHINATNLREPLAPAGGTSVVDVIQRNVDAVLAQRAKTGQPMFTHLNHPNYGWGITAEEILQVRGEQFFEVYNGHPAVRNEGDASHASLDRVWDITLTWRLGVLGLPPMFVLAVDDSHNYHTNAVGQSNPGRGWIMVRSAHLTPEAIIHAMEAGDFYATSGVLLDEVRRENGRLTLRIATDPGVTYVTEFIGTRRGFDTRNEPIRTANGDALRVTHQYSPEVGSVLATQSGPTASFELKNDELYVRARVTSSRKKANPYRDGEFEMAWTQPLVGSSAPAPAVR